MATHHARSATSVPAEQLEYEPSERDATSTRAPSPTSSEMYAEFAALRATDGFIRSKGETICSDYKEAPSQPVSPLSSTFSVCRTQVRSGDVSPLVESAARLVSPISSLSLSEGLAQPIPPSVEGEQRKGTESVYERSMDGFEDHRDSDGEIEEPELSADLRTSASLDRRFERVKDMLKRTKIAVFGKTDRLLRRIEQLEINLEEEQQRNLDLEAEIQEQHEQIIALKIAHGGQEQRNGAMADVFARQHQRTRQLERLMGTPQERTDTLDDTTSSIAARLERLRSTLRILPASSNLGTAPPPSQDQLRRLRYAGLEYPGRLHVP